MFLGWYFDILKLLIINDKNMRLSKKTPFGQILLLALAGIPAGFLFFAVLVFIEGAITWIYKIQGYGWWYLLILIYVGSLCYILYIQHSDYAKSRRKLIEAIYMIYIEYLKRKKEELPDEHDTESVKDSIDDFIKWTVWRDKDLWYSEEYKEYLLFRLIKYNN